MKGIIFFYLVLGVFVDQNDAFLTFMQTTRFEVSGNFTTSYSKVLGFDLLRTISRLQNGGKRNCPNITTWHWYQNISGLYQQILAQISRCQTGDRETINQKSNLKQEIQYLSTRLQQLPMRRHFNPSLSEVVCSHLGVVQGGGAWIQGTLVVGGLVKVMKLGFNRRSSNLRNSAWRRLVEVRFRWQTSNLVVGRQIKVAETRFSRWSSNSGDGASQRRDIL